VTDEQWVRALVRARLEAHCVSSQDRARFRGAWLEDPRWWTRAAPEPRSPFGQVLRLRSVWWFSLEAEWQPPARGEFLVAVRCRFAPGSALRAAGRWVFSLSIKEDEGSAAGPPTAAAAAEGRGGVAGAEAPADALARAGGALVTLAPCERPFSTPPGLDPFVFVFAGTVTVHALPAPRVLVGVADTGGTMKTGLTVDLVRFVPFGEARDVLGVSEREFRLRERGFV
jgi:hypothetical protein